MEHRIYSLLYLISLQLLSVYSEADGDNILDPGLKLIVLLHRRDSFGSPGEDQIPLLQGDEVADVADQIRDGEDHLGGAAALPQLVVHLQPQSDVARVRDAFLGDELADGAGGVEGLGHRPGQTFGLALVLDVPRRHVQAQSVASNVVHSFGFGDRSPPFPDDYPQFHFMVKIVGVPGHQDGGSLP